MNDQNIIGNRIKSRRLELGISQDELARRCGYTSRSTVNKIENNCNNLRQDKIMVFARALETTPEYIMGWDDDQIDRSQTQKAASPSDRMILAASGVLLGKNTSNIKVELIRLVQEMPDDQAEELLVWLKSFLNTR